MMYADHKYLAYLYWLACTAYFAARGVVGAKQNRLEEAYYHLSRCTPDMELHEIRWTIDDIQHNIFWSIATCNGREADRVRDLVREVRTRLMILSDQALKENL